MYWSVVWCSGGCSWECYKTLRSAHFWQGAQSLAPATRSDIWTSKSGSNPWCFWHFDFEMRVAPQRRALFRHLNLQKWSEPLVFFVHFDIEMCVAPQRRALFRHLNLQKWSEALVFLTFWLRNVGRAATACTFRHLNFQEWSGADVFCTVWLRNVLRATTACTFSTSQLPKVVRNWCDLYILTSKCASRRSGVQFFISHLASWLRTRRFSEPTFRPSRATNHWKNTVFRDFPTFRASPSSFFLLFLFSDLLSSNLSLLSASALLFICPYCRKFDF